MINTFAPLPVYSAIQIVACDEDDLLAVSHDVAERAVAGRDASVLLVFSCVARLDVLQERGAEEATRLQAAAGAGADVRRSTRTASSPARPAWPATTTRPSPRSRCEAARDRACRTMPADASPTARTVADCTRPPTAARNAYRDTGRLIRLLDRAQRPVRPGRAAAAGRWPCCPRRSTPTWSAS